MTAMELGRSLHVTLRSCKAMLNPPPDFPHHTTGGEEKVTASPPGLLAVALTLSVAVPADAAIIHAP